MVAPTPDPARLAYEAFAADYDDFTEALDYEPWLAEVLPRLEHWGLAGKRLLDVACGTGKSLIPMLGRGWECSGCDISPAMVRIAREKLGGRARLSVADMRHLPRLGRFDLVWSLNDSINYLLDLNTLLTYRTFFAERHLVEHGGRRLVWQGEAAPDQAPGSIATAHFEVEGEAAGSHVHRQCHFPEAAVRAALDAAGLEILEVLGQDDDGGLHLSLRELDHIKALYIARRRQPLTRRRAASGDPS